MKAPDAYLHGDDGPVVIVPAHVAAYLKRRIPLDQLRIDARSMRDEEVYYVLSSLHRAALAYAPSSSRSAAAPSQTREATASTTQAAGILGLTPRGVRDACERGRLEAELIDGRWRINRASIKRYSSSS